MVDRGAIPKGEESLENHSEKQDAGRALMQELLADPAHEYRSPQFGDVIDGTIMHIDRDEMLVDIGSKSEGIITAREFSSLTDDERNALAVGDKVLVFVTQPESPEGVIGLSIDRARQEKSWRNLQEKHDANDVIEAEVVNYNKGGLLVNLDGVRGFVPASQVTEITTGDEAQKQAEMARLVGRTLQLKIIEINRNRNRLILSERQALQERRDEMKEKLIEELKEGEIRRGRVSSICDFGAFVDVGGADGLVHLSELSWSRVRHPSEVLSVGEEVDVYVLGINAEERKIALSIKRTQPEPWSWVATKYEVGQLVLGTVTQLANFGAFARIEDGIEGLIHVSELAEARVEHPRQVVHEGQELILRIIRIDPARRRMGLSLRRALEATDEEVALSVGPDYVDLKHQLAAIELQPEEPEEPEPLDEPEAEVGEAEETVEAEATDEVVEASAEEAVAEAPAAEETAAGDDDAGASSVAAEEPAEPAADSADVVDNESTENTESEAQTNDAGDDDEEGTT